MGSVPSVPLLKVDVERGGYYAHEDLMIAEKEIEKERVKKVSNEIRTENLKKIIREIKGVSEKPPRPCSPKLRVGKSYYGIPLVVRENQMEKLRFQPVYRRQSLPGRIHSWEPSLGTSFGSREFSIWESYQEKLTPRKEFLKSHLGFARGSDDDLA